MPEFLERADKAILNALFLPLAKRWQRITNTTPARLAWLLAIALAAGTITHFLDELRTDPPLSGESAALFTAIGSVWGLGNLLHIASRTDKGYRARDRFFYELVSMIRLGLGFIVVIGLATFIAAVALADWRRAMPLDLFANFGIWWACLYLVTIYLPPDLSAREAAFGIRGR
jgi:hypothetical protein